MMGRVEGMVEQDWLARRFEDNRNHLRAVAERIRQLDLSILNG